MSRLSLATTYVGVGSARGCDPPNAALHVMSQARSYSYSRPYDAINDGMDRASGRRIISALVWPRELPMKSPA